MKRAPISGGWKQHNTKNTPISVLYARCAKRPASDIHGHGPPRQDVQKIGTLSIRLKGFFGMQCVQVVTTAAKAVRRFRKERVYGSSTRQDILPN